ncbi:MAG: hypothetical protein IKM08_08050 [Clostridia bacterium]|nr:hypothetical protein [Clostridia bacterium]
MPVRVGLQYIAQWKDSLENTVRAYEQEPAPQGQIVFYGPSNFTRWGTKYGMTPLREALVGKSGAPCCVNRGFGSSCPEHHLYYYPRMVRAIAPKVLVYSAGFGNGMAFGYTMEEILELAERVVAYARTDFPDMPIYLCGVHRNATRTEEREALILRYDERMRALAEEIPNGFFIDPKTYEPLNRTDIFVKDGVHYNQEGYQLYGEFFKAALKKELDRF